jgi:hypothetical protein
MDYEDQEYEEVTKFDLFFEDLLDLCHDRLQRDTLLMCRKELNQAFEEVYEIILEEARKNREKLLRLREIDSVESSPLESSF